MSSHKVTNKQRRSRCKSRRRVGPAYPSLLSESELRTRWTVLFALPFRSNTILMASVIPRKKPPAKTGGTRHIVSQVIRDEESRTRPLLATDGLLVLLVVAMFTSQRPSLLVLWRYPTLVDHALSSHLRSMYTSLPSYRPTSATPNHRSRTKFNPSCLHGGSKRTGSRPTASALCLERPLRPTSPPTPLLRL